MEQPPWASSSPESNVRHSVSCFPPIAETCRPEPVRPLCPLSGPSNRPATVAACARATSNQSREAAEVGASDTILGAVPMNQLRALIDMAETGVCST
jgi:hypothetical protein